MPWLLPSARTCASPLLPLLLLDDALVVEGVVQGVGFRPFVWRLATELGLAGRVRNAAGCVEIEVAGPAAALDAFASRLRTDAPPSSPSPPRPDSRNLDA
ncbi:MAG TPA: acylphosphatase [Candidatus Limnocylindrales bacterium]